MLRMGCAGSGVGGMAMAVRRAGRYNAQSKPSWGKEMRRGRIGKYTTQEGGGGRRGGRAVWGGTG